MAGSYDCFICLESLRPLLGGQGRRRGLPGGARVQCSTCNANPYHRSCVSDEFRDVPAVLLARGAVAAAAQHGGRGHARARQRRRPRCARACTMNRHRFRRGLCRRRRAAIDVDDDSQRHAAAQVVGYTNGSARLHQGQRFAAHHSGPDARAPSWPTTTARRSRTAPVATCIAIRRCLCDACFFNENVRM